jgi:hypothetical protein
MADWKKIGVDGGIGLLAGAADQAIQVFDEKRANEARAKGTLAQGKKMPMLKEIGTYVNFGLPILDIAAVAMGWVKGDMATRLTTASFQLAGRKATHRMMYKTTTDPNNPNWPVAVAYTPWQRQMAINASNAAHRDAYRPSPNPQPIEVGPTVPIVQPQSLTGLRGMSG